MPHVPAVDRTESGVCRKIKGRRQCDTSTFRKLIEQQPLNRTEKEWTMPPREWFMAKAQFAVLFGERFTRAMA